MRKLVLTVFVLLCLVYLSFTATGEGTTYVKNVTFNVYSGSLAPSALIDTTTTSNITDTADKRFTSDAEKAAWNAMVGAGGSASFTSLSANSITAGRVVATSYATDATDGQHYVLPYNSVAFSGTPSLGMIQATPTGVQWYTGSAWGPLYTLPPATATTMGGVKVGAGLTISNGVLSTTSTGGGGSGLSPSAVTSNQTIQVGNAYKTYNKRVLTFRNHTSLGKITVFNNATGSTRIVPDSATTKFTYAGFTGYSTSKGYSVNIPAMSYVQFMIVNDNAITVELATNTLLKTGINEYAGGGGGSGTLLLGNNTITTTTVAGPQGADTLFLKQFTAVSSGLSNVGWCNVSNVDGATNAKMAIVSSTGHILAVSGNVVLSSSNSVDTQFHFSSPVSISSGTSYYLAVIGDGYLALAMDATTNNLSSVANDFTTPADFNTVNITVTPSSSGNIRIWVTN